MDALIEAGRGFYGWLMQQIPLFSLFVGLIGGYLAFSRYSTVMSHHRVVIPREFATFVIGWVTVILAILGGIKSLPYPDIILPVTSVVVAIVLFFEDYLGNYSGWAPIALFVSFVFFIKGLLDLVYATIV